MLSEQPTAPLPSPEPAAPAKPKRSSRAFGCGFMVVIFLGLLTVGLIGAEVGMNNLLQGMILAMLPAPIYISIALWLDRFESEPTRLLVYAFLWGATGAVFVSYVLNTLFGSMVAATLSADDANRLMATISAPVVEELAKGLALFALFFWRRDEFDNITDGIVYAAMVALGFAMVENFLYYGRALSEGGDAAAQTFVLRGMIAPFSHPLFTVMTGIGLGWARQSGKKSLRWIGPLLGLSAAIFLHALWNLSASTNGEVFLGVYVVVMMPAFFGVGIVVYFSLKREGNIIRQQLAGDFHQGLLTEEEYQSLNRSMKRMRRSWRALLRGGHRSWLACRRFHQTASELAFHRWRIERDGAEPNEQSQQIEHGHMAQMQMLRQQIRQ